MEITKISTHNRLTKGVQLHMYTIVSGKGSKKRSETRHMSEATANQMRKQ